MGSMEDEEKEADEMDQGGARWIFEEDLKGQKIRKQGGIRKRRKDGRKSRGWSLD